MFSTARGVEVAAAAGSLIPVIAGAAKAAPIRAYGSAAVPCVNSPAASLAADGMATILRRRDPMLPSPPAAAGRNSPAVCAYFPAVVCGSYNGPAPNSTLFWMPADVGNSSALRAPSSADTTFPYKPLGAGCGAGGLGNADSAMSRTSPGMPASPMAPRAMPAGNDLATSASVLVSAGCSSIKPEGRLGGGGAPSNTNPSGSALIAPPSQSAATDR